VQSALLEIADNATGTPQRVSLVANLRNCQLPVVQSASPDAVPQGDLLDLASGRILYDRGGGFERDANGLTHTTAYPTLFGPSSGYFDRRGGGWLPVSNAAVISPDGSRYAYSFFNPDTSGQLHVVDVASGRDRTISLTRDFWAVLAFPSRGIYLDKRYEVIGPGLWLVDPDSGAVQQVLKDGTVDVVEGSDAWLETRNPTDILPPPPTMGEAHNQVVKRDLATGSTTTWLYRPGSQLAVAAVVNGSPVVSRYTGSTVELLMVTSPDQAQRIDLPFTTDRYPSVSGFVSDPQGLWLGTADGVYLWSARTGGALITNEVATPAGTCA